MKKLSFKKGFTLIELLVVIAIIGVLASVILASINTARTKGTDAAIKSQLANARVQAELTYDANGCYGATCSASAPAILAPGACSVGIALANSIFNTSVDSKFSAQISGAIANDIGGYNACSAAVGGTTWAASVGLRTNPTIQAWCVDSSGTSKLETIAANSQAALNGTVTAAGLCL
ncbi:MAG: type II secretion system protein [Candidatus Nomurabacteria bacterium]|nr:type II secretion system protein [Candidatus Nomurabacteria bacterium]